MVMDLGLFQNGASPPRHSEVKDAAEAVSPVAFDVAVSQKRRKPWLFSMIVTGKGWQTTDGHGCHKLWTNSSEIPGLC